MSSNHDSREKPYACRISGITLILLLVLGLVSARATEDKEPESPPKHEATLLSKTRQVTFEGRRAGEGYFSADGSKMVFQSERQDDNPFYQIYLLDFETGDVQRISPGHGKTTCAWIHPAGKKILFASTHDDPDAKKKQREELELRASGKTKRYAWDYDEHYELYTADLDGGDIARLTRARGYDAEGSFSPDGSLIAFASNRHAYIEELSAADREKFAIDKSLLMEIYIMIADGSGVRRLTRVKGYDGGPFFSPTGERLCWRRFSEDGATAEIYTMNIDGSDQRRLTRVGAMSWAPFYHPGGEYLIFTTNKHGFDNFELYIVDVEGRREPVRVTETAGFDGLPVFTPSGTQLFWTTNRTRARQSQIFGATWDHNEALKLLGASPRIDTGGSKEPVNLTDVVTVVTQEAMRPDDLEIHVTALASESMEGRLTGTPGERKATQYVADWFKKFRLEPAGDDGSYFQEFTFTAGVDLGENNQLVMKHEGKPDSTLKLDVDWRPLAFSQNGTFKAAEIVFAGYAIMAPKTDEFEEYDSFVHLDVKDKWVLAFRYVPEDVTPEFRQHLSRHASLRYKAMILRDRGAHGLLLVSGPNSQVKSELIKLGFDASLASTSIPVISLTNEVASTLLASADKELQTIQDKLDKGTPQMGFTLPGVTIEARVDLEKVENRGRNVLGLLRAAPSGSRAPIILVGAHVDHLGRGAGGSLARDEEKKAIHYGADDNASGVACVLEIAEYLASRQAHGKLELQRDILFAAWSGEELGLLGSNHYVAELEKALDKPPHLRDAIAACLNLDMVGRMKETLTLHGIGSSTDWPREIERRNAPVGLPLSLSEDSYLPTNATSFYLKGIPVLSAFTGSHAEYHTPRDLPELLDYTSMARIGRLYALITRGLAMSSKAPEYIKQGRPKNQGARAGLRAYLGTIPDYGDTSIKGVKLSGVAKDGPADKAGVKGGDIIVELAGRKVENIYDYTYAIDALKIGQATKIIVQRTEQRLTLSITPASRE